MTDRSDDLWRVRRRRQPEPEPIDTTAEWEEILQQHRTWAPRSVVRARYHDEARAKQRARADKKTHPATRTSESPLLDTPDAAPPQPRAGFTAEGPPNPDPVPSVAPAPVPAKKTDADFERERFESFEVLAGNGHRLDERWQEVRDWEPEDEPAPYLWNGFDA